MGSGKGASAPTSTSGPPQFALNAGKAASVKAINQSEPTVVGNPFNLSRQFISRGEPLVYGGTRTAKRNNFELDAIDQARRGFRSPDRNTELGEGALGGILSGNVDDSGLRQFMTGGGGLDVLQGQMGQGNPAAAGLAAAGQAPIDTSFLQNTIEAAIDPVRQNIDSQFSLAGRLGSDAHGDAMGRGITDASAPILAQEYARQDAQRLQAQQAAAGVYGQDLQRDAGIGSNLLGSSQQAAQQVAGLGLDNSQLDLQSLSQLPMFQGLEQQRLANYAGAGAELRDEKQRGIDDQLAYINDINSAKNYNLNALLSAGGMGSPLSSSQQSSGGGGGGNFLSSGIGGAASAGALASMIPALGPYALPLIAGGGLLGGLSSFF